jgi:hypothetical protein
MKLTEIGMIFRLHRVRGATRVMGEEQKFLQEETRKRRGFGRKRIRMARVKIDDRKKIKETNLAQIPSCQNVKELRKVSALQ